MFDCFSDANLHSSRLQRNRTEAKLLFCAGCFDFLSRSFDQFRLNNGISLKNDSVALTTVAIEQE